MPKLKKSTPQDNSEESQSIGKYLSFEEKQTQIPEPFVNSLRTGNQEESQSPPRKSKRQPAKKTNRSQKKQISNQNEEQIGKPVQKLSKRKSQAKKKTQPQNLSQNQTKDEKENEKDSNSISIKIEKPVEKRQKSQRLSKKKVKQDNKKSDDQKQDNFRDDQSRKADAEKDRKDFNQDDGLENKSQEGSQKSVSINFNKRLKKGNKETKKVQFDAIFSSYAEDQTSVNHRNRFRQSDDSYGKSSKEYESDLADLQFFQKKKQRKIKKQPEPKIKNKFFRDIAFSCDSSTPQEETLQEGQDPPEDCQELIIEKKEPRKTVFNRKEQIEQKAKQAKDRRQMKVGEHDIKVKNQLKSTMREVQDLEEFQVCVEDPLLATKKGVSGALLIKNAIQKQEKGAKSTQKTTQKQSQSSSDMPLTFLQKTSSNNNIKLQKSGSMTEKQIIKQQQFELQMKKKGVKREDFQKHMVKQIKTKRVTLYTSQEVMDNVKSTSLDDFDLDGDLADDLLSNCSNQSGSRAERRQDRRISVDSQNSRKSNSLSEASQKSRPEKQHSNSASNQINSVNKSKSSWNIEMRQTKEIDQNSNSLSFATNKLPRNLAPLENLTISEAKESDISSSLPPVGNSHFFNLKFSNQASNLTENQNGNFSRSKNEKDQEFLQQKVKKAYPQTYQLLDSENEKMMDDFENQNSRIKSNGEKSLQELIQKQEESNKKIAEKLKKISKKTKQKVSEVDELLAGDEEEQKQKKKSKKHKKNKKPKPSKYSIDTFFQEEAEYSSSEQGHTDQQQDINQQDVDIDGNLKDLLDQNSNIQVNETLIRKKFLQDEQEREKQELDRLMKGMYGKQRPGQSESEIRMKQRMKEAAKKIKLEEAQDEDVLIDGPQQKKENLFEELHASQSAVEVDDERNQKKLEELQRELLYGDRRHHLSEDTLIAISRTVNPFEMLNVDIPEPKNHRAPALPFSGFKNRIENRGKSGQNKKSLLDLKKNNVQQEIHKRTTVDHKRGQSTGNRNKIQKATALDLGIRNKNVNPDQDVEI